jgi:hypothetical protein
MPSDVKTVSLMLIGGGGGAKLRRPNDYMAGGAGGYISIQVINMIMVRDKIKEVYPSARFEPNNSWLRFYLQSGRAGGPAVWNSTSWYNLGNSCTNRQSGNQDATLKKASAGEGTSSIAFIQYFDGTNWNTMYAYTAGNGMGGVYAATSLGGAGGGTSLERLGVGAIINTLDLYYIVNGNQSGGTGGVNQNHRTGSLFGSVNPGYVSSSAPSNIRLNYGNGGGWAFNYVNQAAGTCVVESAGQNDVTYANSSCNGQVGYASLGWSLT